MSKSIDTTEYNSLSWCVMKKFYLLRTVWCLGLIGANLSASFIPALLDAQEPQHLTHVESEHDPNICGTEHEASTCKQGSSDKIFSRGVAYIFGEGNYRSLDYFERPFSASASLSSLVGHQDRAPPII